MIAIRTADRNRTEREQTPGRGIYVRNPVVKSLVYCVILEGKQRNIFKTQIKTFNLKKKRTTQILNIEIYHINRKHSVAQTRFYL